MKAFKTFIASAIAGVMVLSMATSAFAADLTVDSVNKDSVISVSGASAGEGQRTVLVVSKASWRTSGLVDDPEIVYIDQVNGKDALDEALEAMAGLDLTHGEYVVLVGSENGSIDKGAFFAIMVGEPTVDGTNLSWEVTMNSDLLKVGDVKAKFYDKNGSGWVSEVTTLTWGEDVASEITGSGEFTFTAETTVSEDTYAGITGLEISAGTVSGKN